MPDISDLLEREAFRARPSDRWVDGMLEKVRRRRRSRRMATAALALTVAAAGFLVAVRAFTGPAPSQPASQGAPNYQMFARMLEPGEPVPDAAGVQGENFVWIGIDVRWDPTEEPGVHRCTWEVLDAEGNVVSTRTHLYLPHVPISRGEESFFSKMLDLKGEPVEARADCEPERLDTLGITDLEPPPDISDWQAWGEEMDRRVDAWAERFRIHNMPSENLAGNMWALRSAMTLRGGEEDWRALHELSARLGRLCVLLPPEHEFRGGEFCD